MLCDKRKGKISIEEFNEAEGLILKLIQTEEFNDPAKDLRGMKVSRDNDGLYTVNTKITHDLESFQSPVLLPAKHALVELLIKQCHLDYCHAGTQFLMSKLRERFWILRGRKTISRVINKCTTCQRYRGKSYQTEPAPLPLCRTQLSRVFETSGVDLAGPLYMKSGEKAWLVLFTCAVFRCIHLDFVMSLSTEAFINALERFISVRGRPSVIYSDNGSNFIGVANLFQKLNWSKIEESANTKRIKWIFNPPSAAWWGGWWERLIRTVKDLLKRMLGNAKLNSEQLRTWLAVVENVVNERPLTAVTEDTEDLVPLTPAMFLRGINTGSFPEGNLVASAFAETYHKRQKLQKELKLRFRSEYLSLLVHKTKEQPNKVPQVGDIVLVGDDDRKKIHWPLAKIIELFPGRDGVVRAAKVKTHSGILVRPVRKLYPLEITSQEEACDYKRKLTSVSDKTEEQCSRADERCVLANKVKTSKCGRLIKTPERFKND